MKQGGKEIEKHITQTVKENVTLWPFQSKASRLG